MRNFITDVDIYAGEALRRMRKRRGFTQKQLADAIGITFQQVQKYEKGVNRISLSMLYQVADFFNVSILYFFDLPRDELQLMEAYRKCSTERKHVLLALAGTYGSLAEDDGGMDEKPSQIFRQLEKSVFEHAALIPKHNIHGFHED